MLRLVQIAGLIGIALLNCQGVWAQTEGVDPCREFLCPDYANIKNKLNLYIQDSLVNEALDEYKALAACDKCPEHQEELDSLNIVIFDILRDQLERAEENARQLEQQKRQLERQKAQISRESARRQRLLSDLEAERDRNLAITRDALASQYMGLAQRLYESYEENTREKAFWLTDFVFRYIAADHHMVQSMMHRLYAEQENLGDLLSTDEEEGIFTAIEPEISVVALAWSSDKQWLAAGLDDGRLVLFNRSGVIDTIILPLAELKSPFNNLAWHPKNNELVISNTDGAVFYIEKADPNWLITNWELFVPSTINQLKWSPDGTQLAIPTSDNNILIYEKGNLEPLKTLSGGHTDWVRDVAWSPDGQSLVSVSDDQRVNIWDMAADTVSKTHQQHADWIYAVDWHPTQPLIVSGGNDDEVLAWNYQIDSIQAYSDFFASNVRRLQFSEDGRRVLVTRESEAYLVLSQEERSFEQDYDRSPYLVRTAAWLNSTTFSFGGESPQVTTYSVNQTVPQVTDSIPLPELDSDAYSGAIAIEGYTPNAILEAAWSPSGDQLLTSSADGLLVLYNDTLSQVIRLANNQINLLAWEPGLSSDLPYSNRFATADARGQLSIWDASTLSIVQTVPASEGITALCWSTDGEYLATGDEYGQLNVWRADPLELVVSELIHEKNIRDLAWSPDGRYILSGSDDYSIGLWHTETQTITFPEQIHRDWVREVVWVDQDRFISVSDDYTAFLWGRNGTGASFVVTDTLSDPAMKGYYYAADLVREDQYLAIGTQDGDVGFWFIEGQKARLDTVLHVGGSISDVNWHPTRLELVMANTGLDYPLLIDRYLNFSQQYQLENFPTIERSLSVMGEAQAIQPLFNRHQKVFDANAIQWTPDDRLVAIIREDRSAVQVFDVANNALLYELKDFPDGYRTAFFSFDGQYLACSSIDGAVTIYETSAGQNPTPVLAAPNLRDQNWINWAATKPYLAIVNNQGKVQVWDQARRAMIYDRVLDEVYTNVHFSPANPNLLALGSTNSLVLLDIRQPDRPPRQIYRGESFVLDKGWVKNGEALVVLFSNDLPVVYGLSPSKRSSGANFGSKDFSFWDVNPDGQSLFSYVQENTDRAILKEKERNAVQIWDLVSREQKGVLNPTKDRVVTSIDLSPDESFLATASYSIVDNYIREEESVIHIWDVQNQRSVFELSLPPVKFLRFSPDGQYLVTYLENKSALFWPMDIEQIHTYLLRNDKDAFLQYASSGEAYPLAGLINEWRLENDLLLDSLNFSRLKEESAAVRLGWGQYFLNRARLAPPDDAQLLFERALSMIQEDEMVPLRGDIQIARARNFFQRGEIEQARTATRRAYEANSEALNIRSFTALLDWQEGRKKSAFHQLSTILLDFGREGEETLRTDFLQLQDYEVRFPDENVLWRLITRDLPAADEDYERQAVLPYVMEPYMEELTQDYDAADRRPYLSSYFDLHVQNMSGERPDTTQLITFFERAVSFLNEAYDSTNLTREVLNSYYFYQSQLSTVYIFRRQYEQAYAHMEDFLAASRMEYQQNSSTDNANRYYFALAQKAWIIMLKDRETVTPRQLLRYIDQDSSLDAFLHSRYGHLAMMENRPKDAYSIYYQVFSDVDYRQDVIDYIYAEINLIDPIDLIHARRLFNTASALEKSRAHLQEIRSEIGSTSSNQEDKLLLLFRQKIDTTQNVLAQVRYLINNELLPQDTLRGFLEEYASDHAYLAHYLLLNERFSEAEQMARKAMDMDPQLDWPLATIANVQMFQGQWKECRKTCSILLEKEYDSGLVIFDGYEDHILGTAGALSSHPNAQQYLPRLKALFKNKKR